MITQLNKKGEAKKGIQELLKFGIFKKYNKQLYELPIVVLQKEFNHLRGELKNV
ncbi:Fur-regulated basic protein FbpA [Peribacillus muralis]|uniref:Fur-regulated basic protein FbpA n=1 Tax=Peribacillus muralis TaxID=264697 RepID=UPI001F4D48CB|nr:Fur-regulated basic protein FbpA [Peribacillus muralis]MCK1992083.1 Fur-regulated basic protein FbpA [Peribacillus muralis]MCK2012639.1 Fur-regulated basic protein FbpA [Peribacillus muralis]